MYLGRYWNSTSNAQRPPGGEGGYRSAAGVRKPLQKLLQKILQKLLQKLLQEWLQLHTKGAVITEDVRTKRLDWSG